MGLEVQPRKCSRHRDYNPLSSSLCVSFIFFFRPAGTRNAPRSAHGVYVYLRLHPMKSRGHFSYLAVEGEPVHQDDSLTWTTVQEHLTAFSFLSFLLFLFYFFLLGFFLGVYYIFLAGPPGPLVSVELPLSYSLYTGTAALPHRPYQRARYCSRLV